MDGCVAETLQEDAPAPASDSQALPEEIERKARVDSIWKQMNKGVSEKTLNSIIQSHNTTSKKSPKTTPVKKSSTGWMGYLGLGGKAVSSSGKRVQERHTTVGENGTSDEAKKIAAAALQAVKDAAALAATGRGKVEITEVRDFAGKDIEVKKLVDPDSKEAEKGKGSTSAVDAVLEQIKKKQKLSVLDKTKKDWGEFKEENKGMEDELDAYKKSSNQYLDKVSFLQRTDYREFERERDARLAVQARRGKADMREDDM